MRDECYHYKIVKSNKPFTKEQLEEYETLLPKFVETVSEWWDSYPQVKKEGWLCKANLIDGILIDSPGELFDNPILMRANLDNTLTIGWQNRHYGTHTDPKVDVAEKLFNIIDNSEFIKVCIEDDAEQNTDYLYYEDRSNDFTLYSGYYSTGRGDSVYAFRGQGPDFTACSSDCGRCDY